MTLQATIETITPQIAEEYLKKNENVRRITWGVVDKYAEDMKNGRWKLTSATIGFDKNGNLKDGQHRLNACVKSGCSFQSIVVRGMEPDADSVVDIGKTRTASDQLKSFEYPDKIASLARLACSTKSDNGHSLGIASYVYGKWGYEKDGKKTINKVVSIPLQVEDAKANYEEYLECVRQGNRLQKRFLKYGTVMYAYFIWLVRWLGEDECLDNFIDDLCAKLATSQTASVARDAIYRKENKADKVWLIATLLYAYGNYRDGKEIERILQPTRCIPKWDEKIKAKKSRNNSRMEDEHEQSV